MGLQISQEAVYYIILMVVVIFIGITYFLQTDIKSLFSGEDIFALPKVEITEITRDNLAGTCETSGLELAYRIPVNIKIDLKSSKNKEAVDIYPILDVGNNPAFAFDGASPKAISCTPVENSKDYSCTGSDENSGPFQFSLDLRKLQDDSNLGRNSLTPVQIYFFRKTDAIRDYITEKTAFSGRTTSNLVQTFTDFYITSYYIGYTDTTCTETPSLRRCEDLDINTECGLLYPDQCYRRPSGGNSFACVECPQTSDCSRYDTDSCGQCQTARQRCFLDRDLRCVSRL